AGLCSGAGAGLVIARTDAQPPLTRGYLPGSDSARRGGGELMQPYLTLTRRELSAYFLSLTGYIVISSTLGLMGLAFWDLLRRLQQEPMPMPVTQLFYVTWYFPLILAVPIPIIT